jgi:two-component system sensor histidine kinase KdpD
MSTKILRAVRIAAALLAIFLVTLIFKSIAAANATTVGFGYLITILLIAASWGIAESVLASIAATFCFNFFFLPPLGTWTISDPENWVALFAFLITSLIASELSRRARRRGMEMEKLYSLSRSIMLMDASEPIGEQVARELVRICEIPAVAIYDSWSDSVFYGGSDGILSFEGRLREVATKASQSRDDASDTLFAAIRLGGQSTGSIAMPGGGFGHTALQALLNLIAIALENARSREVATRSQAARQSQEFKSTLLDGLAHEFKTPLTSIRAATTALLGSSLSGRAQREFTMIVDQEAERLGRLVTEATHIARIEAGHIHIDRQWLSIALLVENVLAEMEVQRDGRRIEVMIAPDLPEAFIDGDLIELALRQLVDNALKYSVRETAIQISAKLKENDFIISVRNQADPLSQSERERIFEKFYRGQNVRHQVAGTGMGLPVARDILLAHGGDIFLQESNESGTEFIMRIPATEI